MKATVRALAALADVICRAQTTTRTPMGIAFAIDSAGLLMSPETAADMQSLRIRNAELEEAVRLYAEDALSRAERAKCGRALSTGQPWSDHPAVTP